MKKMMIYLLATGVSVFAAIPTHANEASRHRHRTKEEKREARAERKEARAEKREERRTGMTMSNMNTTSPMPVNSYNTMWYPQAALPVMEDYIPSDILSNLKTTYGSDLYDVTSMKCNNGGDCYTVRVIKNGAVQTFVVNSDGNTVVQ
ncbi:DUF1682 domain-containing protein [Chitinophaga varians]|uniref:DUF1682 domain-containing protein n=1 Tax=Chitinophaga varians TaxID=2202339 RepID=A0A847RIB4_9BACT|nr:DUF1682 domain-containing protein [Chitinophaga varians]NLR62843.1 DUF1682 domain-containing protein [Chitinophaga varians]